MTSLTRSRSLWMIPELISFPVLVWFLFAERFFNGWELQWYTNAACLAWSSHWDRTVLSSPATATTTTTTTATMAFRRLEPAGMGKRRESSSWQWPQQFDGGFWKFNGGFCKFASKSGQNGAVSCWKNIRSMNVYIYRISLSLSIYNYKYIRIRYLLRKVSVIWFRETKTGIWLFLIFTRFPQCRI